MRPRSGRGGCHATRCLSRGVGGCPFAPGAQGNVATEDLVYVLEREGVATGVDLDALVETARWLESALDRRLPGHVHRADRWPA